MGKKKAAAIPILVVLSLFLSARNGPRLIRRLSDSSSTIKNVITDAGNLENIPSLPKKLGDDVPLYLSLCQEWLRQDTLPEEVEVRAFRVISEDLSICLDWSSPHLSILDIVASSMIALQIPNIQYSHNCGRSQKFSQFTSNFNITTLQQALGLLTFRSGGSLLTITALKQQCRRCLIGFDKHSEESRVRSKGYHHCLLWPTESPDVPSQLGRIDEMASFLLPVIDALHNVARTWKASEKPLQEEDSGLVIWLDSSSVGLEYDEILKAIPRDSMLSSISVLSGMGCVNAHLPTGQRCHDYGEGLAKYLEPHFPELSQARSEVGQGITFKIITSTAAAFSRMALSKSLLCPPRTPSCLFPSITIGVNGGSAIILDDPQSLKATAFLEWFGNPGNVIVKVIEDDKNLVFRVPDDDGFVEHGMNTHPISDEVIVSMTPYQILERNSIAASDLRGLRFDLFETWQESEYRNHSALEIAHNTMEDQFSKDAQGCSDISTLHLNNDTKVGKELWRDYNVEIEYRHKVHHVHDPGIVSIPAHDHCYMVFHEVQESKVKMSIWNDFDHFDYFMSHFTAPDRESVFKTYPFFDLLDGDYFTVSNHFPGNYGHFLHDHLPFIAYARHMLPKHTKFILVNNEADKKRLQFIDPQFESERVIWAEQKMIYKVSAGSISGLPPAATRHIINRYSLLREWVLMKPSFRTDQRTIIYYTRGGFDVRNGRLMDPLHEKVLISLIKQKMMEHGRNEHLVIFDGKENGQPMSLQHQFDLFRTARVVIGPHGSGLANILWLPGATTCEERPKVLEFLVQPTQTDIQVGGSLKTYMYLYGFPKWVDYHHLYYTSYSTSKRMSVDVKLFVQALDDIFQNEPSPSTSSRTTRISNLLRTS